MEEETLSFYPIKRQVNSSKNKNESYRYYDCTRSGSYKPRGRGLRSIKCQKSSKIGKKCPSRISLKITESTLFVKFYKVHEGHEQDLEHLRLPSDFRAAIAGKQLNVHTQLYEAYSLIGFDFL